MIVAALPYACERIDRLRAAGRRVPIAVSNDLARVRGVDPLVVRERYRASAASVVEYEQLVRELKHQEIADADRAEQLAEVILAFAPPREPADHSVIQVRLDVDLDAAATTAAADSHVPGLTELAERFIASSERLAALLGAEARVDWSGVVIGYCKAAEVEAVERLLVPLCHRSGTASVPADDRDDRALSSVVRFCEGGKPPELGTLRFFLGTAATSKRRIRSSRVLQEFVRLAERWPGREWILGQTGALAVLDELTTRYRNTAAHTGELD